MSVSAVKPSVRSTWSVESPQVAVAHMNGRNGYEDSNEETIAFETENFDAKGFVDAKFQSMTEKGIRKLCDELTDLKKASAEEMRKAIYANYDAFISTSQEISELEGEIQTMRNLLSTQATLIHILAESGASISSGPAGTSLDTDYYSKDGQKPTDLEIRAEKIPDILDVLLAERKVEEMLAVLEEGDQLVAEGHNRSDTDAGLTQVAISELQEALSERRARLVEDLAETVQHPTLRESELRSVIAALDRLGDGLRAHTLLLHSHYDRLQRSTKELRPSEVSNGGVYTAALSQLVFSTIAQASRDSVVVFGEETAYASELVLWAHSITQHYSALLNRHVLSSAAVAGGLRAAAECVRVAFAHCVLLEKQGLSLCPTLSKLMRPSVEQALQANLTRIDGSVAALAAADDWVLDHPTSLQHGTGMQSRLGMSIVTSNLRLSSSAHRFNFLVQDFLEDVGSLISMQLGGMTLDGLSTLFDQYVNLLIKAVPNLDEDEEPGTENSARRKVRLAVTEGQQLALIGNAAALADELLPRAASKLVPSGLQVVAGDMQALGHHGLKQGQSLTTTGLTPELKDWKRQLQRAVDRLKDHLCRQLVLHFFFADDAEGDSKLSPTTYLNLDNDSPTWHEDPMPSPMFQSLFMKLTSMQQTAMDVLVGRDRVAQLFLMRLTEAFVIWLSDDQEFWEAIEQGARSLGAIGLQQFVLDMHFLKQVSLYGKFLSRITHQLIGGVIERACSAFAATGADPSSTLPDDDWFLTTAQEDLHRLLEGWSQGGTAVYNTGSPTASISAISLSSMHSE
ncbi:unnamed protein product [Sphagnum jensenii]|uniref:Exocyst component Exo84 C-terminal domain-containing protein n=1 Tax=Sphagnum jensenii TaxID=128206 RepID=A0ABP1BYB1_9BRYO